MPRFPKSSPPFVGMFIIYLHTNFEMSISSGLLIVAFITGAH
jgi:hypothetical protein